MEGAHPGGLRVPRFARGFVLSETEVVPPEAGWSSEQALGLHLTRAPEVAVTQADHAGFSVIVLGHLVDTALWLPQTAALTSAVEALARSESEFLDLTDAWSGRYLVVYGDSTSRRVMTDAAGMRSAFYALDGPFVLSSHARLVAAITGAPESPIVDAYRAAKEARVRTLVLPMPGRTTPWTGVVSLTANLALEVDGRRLRRIFPRGALPTMDARSAASIIGPRLRGQVESLVASGRPVALSVTAGRDSRVSLAASRPSRDAVSYFTYARHHPPLDDWDVATARSMAAALGLPHRVLEVTAADEGPELAQARLESTTMSHGGPIVGAYRRSFPSDTIHIRSNIGEVGRSYYLAPRRRRRLEASPGALTPDTITRLWGHGAPASTLVVEAFDDWMQAAAFADVEAMDPLDLFYWEHRMSVWHAGVLLESDFAFDTHVLFNARTILRDMLAVPVDDRVRSTVFDLLVADLWPELERWPYKEVQRPKSTAGAGRPRTGALRRRIGRLLAR